MMQGMEGCAVKRGFFVLRDCGNPAMNTCQSCGRPVCREHRVASQQSLLCVDCHARQQQTLEQERLDAFSSNDARTESSLYAYRHSYYTHSHYAPFYTGLYYSNYYDTYDARAFNRRDRGGDFDADDGTDSSFWAS
jgi:hypothetical protein